MNVVVLMGRMTRDPELRSTSNNTAVANFSIAMNRKFKRGNGEVVEEVSFIECAAFGVTAEALGKYFAKGSKILLQGQLRQESWQDKTSGEKRSKVYVLVDSFNFVDPKREVQDSPAPQTAQAPNKDELPQEEIPF